MSSDQAIGNLGMMPVPDAQPAAPPVSAVPAPQSFTQDAVVDALKGQQQDNALVLRSTLKQAMQQNPEDVAKAIPLAEQAHLPLLPTMRNMQEVQRQQQFTPEYVEGLLRDHPDTSAWLSDPANVNLNANIAHDDVSALTKIENVIKAVPNDMMMGMASLWNTAAKGDYDTELALVNYKKMMGENTPEDDANETQLRELSKQAEANTLPIDNMGFTGRVISIATGMAPMLGNIASHAAVGSILGGVAGAAAGNPIAGGTIGEETERANAEFKIFSGQAYDQLSQVKDDQGNTLDPSVIKPVAMAIGAINAGMTHIGLGKLAETIPGVKDMLAKGELNALLKSPEASQQLMQIAKAYGLGVAGSAGMMGGQAAISDVGQNIAQDLSKGNFKDKSLGEILSDVWENVKVGGGIGALLGFPGTALSASDVLARSKTQPHPEDVANYVGAVRDAVANSKLAQRSPDVMRSFLSKGMGDEDYFVNPEKVATFYHGLTDEERAALDFHMPEFQDSMNQSLTEHTDMPINRADYHSYMGPLGPSKGLDEALKLVPEHLSLADIQDQQEMLDALKPSPEDTNYDSATARENFIGQLIQQYGQKAAWSGNVDIAQQLGGLHEQAYNAFSNRYGQIPGAQDLIDRAYKDLIVRRNGEFITNAGKADDFDLQIDRARNMLKAETARAAARVRAAADKGPDLLGQTKTAKAKEEKTPTPILDWLQGKGKVKTGSSAAKDLGEIGVTPKTHKNMFSKYGSVEALDSLDFTSFHQDLGDVAPLPGADTGDNKPNYVDKDALIQAIHDETLGKGQSSDAERLKGAEKEYYARLADAIDQSGADLLNDSTPDIKKALAALKERLAAEGEGGQRFEQSDNTGPRGSLTIHDNGKAIMDLFQKEDASTVLHELGHLYWNVLDKIGKMEGANDEVKADIATMRKWVGAEDGKELTTEQHEKIADGFLAYIRTGEAPSAELQSAFSRFKSWMTRLYSSLKGTDTLPSISKDVAGVFDRMLATDEQIEAMKDNPEFKLDDAIKNMLSKADQERAQRQVNRWLERSKETLLAKALRQMEREGTADYKAKREAIHKDMVDHVNNSEPFRIIDAIKKAGGLNRKALVELKGGKEILPYMPGGKDKVVAGKGGVDPSMIARLMNMDPHAMIDKITDIESRKVMADRLTDDEMIRRHGDMLHDGTMEREAVEKAHNEHRANVLGLELKALSDKAKIVAPTKEAIKAKAGKFLGEKAIRDVKPYVHQRAEVQAARAVGKALAEKDYTKAAQYKAQELLNHFMFKMATEAKYDIEKQQKKWRRLIGGSDDDVAKIRTRTVTDENGDKTKTKVRLDIDYVYAARAILAKYGLGKSNYDFTGWFNTVKGENPDLADSLAQAMAMWDNPPDATQRQIRNGRYAGRTVTTPPWHYMTLNDFRGLSDAIDNLMHVAEQQNVMTINRGTDKEEKVPMQDVLEAIKGQLSIGGRSSVSSGYEKELSKFDHTKWNLLSAKASYRRIEQLIKSIDRGETGVGRKFIWNPVKDALGIYRDEEKVWMARIRDILAPHRDRLFGDTIAAPELTSEEAPKGYTFTDKGQLIGMLLHLGNDSNKDKLLRGYDWKEDDFEAFKERMFRQGVIEKQDMQLVQSLWDLVDELKPQAQRAMKEMHGYRFDEITAAPVDTPFGQFKGGYWPAVVDRNVSEDAQIRQDNEAISTGGQTYMFPSTGRGFTKTRNEAYAGPLEMSLNLLPSHIDKVLRFIHVEPAIKDVAKIVMNRDFRDTAQKVDRTLTTEMLVPWLQRSARQITEMPIQSKAGKFLNKTAGWLRRQAGAAVFMGNLPNTFIHMGQIFPLLRLAGPEHVGEAMWKLTMDRENTQIMIRDLSPEIRNRGLPGDITPEAQVRRLMTDRGAYTKFNDWTNDHAYVLQHLVWSEIDHIGWLSSFNKAMEGGIDGIDSGDQMQSVRHADAVVRELQGSHNPEDISNMEARSHFAKLFQFWWGYFNNSGNVMMTETANIARDRSMTGGAKAAGLFTLALMNVVMVSTWAELTSGTARGATPAPQDYKDTPSWLLAMGEYLGSGLLRYSSGIVHPGLAAAINFAVGELSGAKGFSDHIVASPLLTTAEDSIKEFPSLYKAMFKHGDWETAFNEIMGGPLGIAFPITGAVKRLAAYAIGMAEGKIRPQGPLDVGRGILGGPRPGNMKQR